MNRAVVLALLCACGSSSPEPQPEKHAPPEGKLVGPSPDPKTIDSDMDQANRLYDRQDFDEALLVVNKVLLRDPTNVRMLRLAVSIACVQGDFARARKHAAALPAPDRAQMQKRCARYGVALDSP